MLNKIDIPGTSITLEIVDKTITITNKIEYDMQMVFRNQDADTSSLGVKAEKRNLTELQKFFEFVEDNKRNLFDLCGIKGELQ